ncbi:MAG: hypothetical protein CBC16_06125 [Verrucomicrobia bacterium TMED56]|nr:MAG: hypothetical protein CBC16_06125 [Verrucomicrobia bacterium TMED56]
MFDFEFKFLTMTKLLLTIIISNALFSFVLLGQQSNSRYKEEEKEYLFPGTGFFVKNRKPYENNEAINWFREAYSLELKGEYGKALSLYEKFSKRRSDALVKIDSKQFKVGPEALFRAARIRETRGDWSKSFDLLRLIAQAYSDYEFDIVASSLMRVAERLANEKLPKKWGLVPRFRSGSQDRMRLNQIAGLAKGPKFAPRALMTLAEISIKDDREEEAIDALQRIINLYPENFLCEKAYYLTADIYREMSSGSSYDQGKSVKALNYYEDYLILYQEIPPRGVHETEKDFKLRNIQYSQRKELAEEGRKFMRETLAASKLEIGTYIEEYGKYYLTNWQELGDGPALQFYNEAVTVAPESAAARAAEKRIANLKNRVE